MSDQPMHLEVVFMRGRPDGWKWFRLERMNNGTLVTGGVPIGVVKSGKRKGRPKWGPMKTADRVFVADADLDAEKSRYEREEGKCHECYGDGQTIASFHVTEGHTYRTCSRCKGSKIPPTDAAMKGRDA